MAETISIGEIIKRVEAYQHTLSLQANGELVRYALANVKKEIDPLEKLKDVEEIINRANEVMQKYYKKARAAGSEPEMMKNLAVVRFAKLHASSIIDRARKLNKPPPRKPPPKPPRSPSPFLDSDTDEEPPPRKPAPRKLSPPKQTPPKESTWNSGYDEVKEAREKGVYKDLFKALDEQGVRVAEYNNDLKKKITSDRTLLKSFSIGLGASLCESQIDNISAIVWSAFITDDKMWFHDLPDDDPNETKSNMTFLLKSYLGDLPWLAARILA